MDSYWWLIIVVMQLTYIAYLKSENAATLLTGLTLGLLFSNISGFVPVMTISVISAIVCYMMNKFYNLTPLETKTLSSVLLGSAVIHGYFFAYVSLTYTVLNWIYFTIRLFRKDAQFDQHTLQLISILLVLGGVLISGMAI